MCHMSSRCRPEGDVRTMYIYTYVHLTICHLSPAALSRCHIPSSCFILEVTSFWSKVVMHFSFVVSVISLCVVITG